MKPPWLSVNYICETLKKKKCTAYSGDNANLNFGVSSHNEGNNVFTHLKYSLNVNMVGVGCPAHI